MSKQNDIYNKLLCSKRRRKSSVSGRSLEEEADADRGRVLFSAPFRRLQNKAQVFSLETNASVRSRLTHSLEVSSIGRYVAQQAIRYLGKELAPLGIAGKERPFITFVEAACLIHDLGNPPFGHFGEAAISSWFQDHESDVMPKEIGGNVKALWDEWYKDFTCFDGNPQGFRIATKLQSQETGDLNGMNLTATSLAAMLKYPWGADQLIAPVAGVSRKKKAGYYRSELDTVKWVRKTLGLKTGCRHPLVYLMEAADDIAYCISDIDDGIEKDLIDIRHFSHEMKRHVSAIKDKKHSKYLRDMQEKIERLETPEYKKKNGETVKRLAAMQDFRASIFRYLAHNAGELFSREQTDVLNGEPFSLLRDDGPKCLLQALKNYADMFLYRSTIVRDRELTAHAVISGLFDGYRPLMEAGQERFRNSMDGKWEDTNGVKITGEMSLISRISDKHRAVYTDAVNASQKDYHDEGCRTVLERIHRLRLIVDQIGGMTDEFALQSFRLMKGIELNRQRQ